LKVDTLLQRILGDVKNITAQQRLAPSYIDVEYLHLSQIVEDYSAFFQGELIGSPLARGRETVDTMKIACGGKFPGDAKRCHQSWPQKLIAH
jgi:hypothetical protein